MSNPPDDLDEEDRKLDLLWRRRFGQPMPLRGHPELIREVLRLCDEGQQFDTDEAG